MTVISAIPASVSISATPGDTVCGGTDVTFAALPVNGGNAPAFQWFLNGNPTSMIDNWTLVPANGDKIWCRVISALTCATGNPAFSDTITMTVTTALTSGVSISANHAMICPGTSVIFTADPVNEGAAPDYEWLVDGVRMQQGLSPVFTSSTLLPGQEVLCRMTSSIACVAQQTVTSAPVVLSPAPQPSVNLADEDFLCAGNSTPLDAGENFTTYSWQDGTTGRYMAIPSEGIYWVRVTDSLGCTASDSVLVKSCAGNVYVPDAFTPNGDGLNDIFRVFADPDEIATFSMMIFNRWGEQVFGSDNVLTGWDGIKQGQYCPADTYVWKIQYKSTAGGSSAETVVIKGTLQLVK
jgi:gliding motility-associated-like protein